MANVVQQIDVMAQTFPYRQAHAFSEPNSSYVPWGQAIVNKLFTSNAIGAGDTGTLVLDVNLPSDYVSMPRGFHLQSFSTTVNYWRDGILGVAYQQPGGPYEQSVMKLPETSYLWFPLEGSDDSAVRNRAGDEYYWKGYSFSSKRTAGQPSPEPGTNYRDQYMGTPLWIPPQWDALLQQRSIVINLENDTGGASSDDWHLNMVFDLFTLEQGYTAAVMSSPRVFSS
jgi:hypothetical protein